MFNTMGDFWNNIRHMGWFLVCAMKYSLHASVTWSGQGNWWSWHNGHKFDIGKNSMLIKKDTWKIKHICNSIKYINKVLRGITCWCNWCSQCGHGAWCSTCCKEGARGGVTLCMLLYVLLTNILTKNTVGVLFEYILYSTFEVSHAFGLN